MTIVCWFSTFPLYGPYSMPLITCPECNRQISDKARACPHCGLPMRGRARWGSWFLDVLRADLRPLKIYGALCLSAATALSGLQVILFLFDSDFLSSCVGLLGLVGVLLILLGFNPFGIKDRPATRHPGLALTAWALFGTGMARLHNCDDATGDSCSEAQRRRRLRAAQGMIEGAERTTPIGGAAAQGPDGAP